jgi:hypothetical protein
MATPDAGRLIRRASCWTIEVRATSSKIMSAMPRGSRVDPGSGLVMGVTAKFVSF